ncbi:MAG: polysaccharide lyase [Thermoleophilia bacterium]|nr:polysaccharide lyase [Thermoleophilia bacterium]
MNRKSVCRIALAGVAGVAAAAGLGGLAQEASAGPRVVVNGVVLPGWSDNESVIVDQKGKPYHLEGRGTERLAAGGRRKVQVAGELGGAGRDAPGVRRLLVSTHFTGKRALKPKSVKIRGLRNRSTVRGKRRLAAKVRTRGRLELRINGRRRAHRAMRRAGTGRLSWNSRSVKNGSHLVELSLWRGSRRIGVDRRWVKVSNSGSPSSGGGGVARPPVGPNEPLPGTRVFSASYENGSTSPWRVRETVSAERIKVVSSPKAAQGNRSVRFEVRPGEDPLGNFGDRAELAFAGPSIEEGQEYWYEWFTLFPQGFPTESSRVWQVFSQWHSRGNGPPPLGWYIDGNQMVLTANRHAAERQNLGARILWRGAIKPGQWRRIRMNVKFSGSDSVGFVRLWIDGKQVISKASVRTTYPGLGNYFKQGYYRCACSNATAVVHHDGLTITKVN